MTGPLVAERAAAVNAASLDWVGWAVVLGPAATLVAGLVAGVVAYLAIAQRRRADAKAEWWRRTQWALDEVLSGEPDRRRVGVAVLYRLAESELATPEDLEVFDAAWGLVLGIGGPVASAAPEPSATEVTAARGRVLTDGRRGVATADWVVRLAVGASGPAAGGVADREPAPPDAAGRGATDDGSGPHGPRLDGGEGLMGIDDMKDKASQAAKSDKAEGASDSGLDKAESAASSKAGEGHEDKVAQARDKGDEALGNA
ncbi:antitoxin [Cellulomonas chengniuliangii]|uniref:antitoxin n=1 Tax=Cellulomonas chengniuliangii TaxID=2968084 RepID=UPI001D0E2C61|nr:antitoxin [Cellulomonas chengniuliangii]MCC2318312.1 antitoxin [Cellulomonas chengniuliangii]